MRKSRWLSWFSNDLPDYFLVTGGIILLLASLLRFIYTFHLYEQAEVRHLTIGVWWWFERITWAIGGFTYALWVVLWWYKIQLRKKLETIEHAKRMRKIVYIFWWTTIIAMVFAIVRIFAIFYNNPNKSVFYLIISSLIVFLLVHTLVVSWTERRYYSKQPLCNIAAAGLLEKYTRFLDEQDDDKAYNAIIKACETAPEGTCLWCTLASFCEFIRNNATESDKYMAKARELIHTSNGDRACYFNFLGMILYRRGEYEKGLEYMKQSIDIEPTPGRIKTYENKLSEFKVKQQDVQS